MGKHVSAVLPSVIPVAILGVDHADDRPNTDREHVHCVLSYMYY